MTFKDLQRVIESHPASQQSQLQRLKGKPFWFWKDVEYHRQRYKINKGQDCFNHLIGLPKKNGKEYPLWDYEKELYKALMLPGYLNSSPALSSADPNNIMYPFKEKHLLVLKATGLGITTFFLDSWHGYVFTKTIIEIVRWLL